MLKRVLAETSTLGDRVSYLAIRHRTVKPAESSGVEEYKCYISASFVYSRRRSGPVFWPLVMIVQNYLL